MDIIGMFALFLLFGLPVLSVTLIVMFVIIRATGSRGKLSNKQQAEETRLMQDMHHGLSKLEKRIEDLETIVLQSEFGKGDSNEA